MKAYARSMARVFFFHSSRKIRIIINTIEYTKPIIVLNVLYKTYAMTYDGSISWTYVTINDKTYTIIILVACGIRKVT